MKKNTSHNIRKNSCILFFLFLVLNTNYTLSQCAGGTLGGGLTPVPATAYQTMAVNANSYYTFVVPTGCLPTYDFSLCPADGGVCGFDSQITILDNSGVFVGAGGYQDDVCGSNAKVTWTPTASGTYRVLINVFNCGVGTNAATLAYRATIPPNMTFTSSTSVDVALGTNIERCGLSIPMTRVEVVTGGGNCNALTLSQLNINITGTASFNTIDKVHIYYTGTTNTFSATNEFVVGGLNPAASLAFNDTRTLTVGTNYFWVTYDFNNTGVIGNTIGSQLPATGSLTVTTPRNPTATPNCLKTYIACPAYPTSSSLWLKGDAGTNTTVNNATVSSWNSQAAAPVVSVTQAAVGLRPIYRDGSGLALLNRFNYNPFLFTDGTSNRLTQAGNIDLGNTTNGFSVYQVIGEDLGIVSMEWYNSTNGNIKCKGDGLLYISKADGTMEQNIYNCGTFTPQAFLQSVRGVPNGLNGTGKYNGASLGTYGTGWRVAATTGITIGSNLDNGEFMQGGMGEFLIFPSVLSSTISLRIESYLALKYGITLGNNSAPSNYISSDGTIIWSGNSVYQNNIIGIGRDNAAGSSTLFQKQSHYFNDEIRLYKGTLAATNILNSSTFAVDKSFVITGSNNGAMCATTGSIAEMPATCGLYSRIEREFRVVRTNMAENFNMDFRLAACGAPGSVNVADLRVLVDDDGNFANGGTQCFFNGDGTGVVISYTNPYITVSNINTANHIPNNQTRFLTIGSTNVATPLPIELLDFNAALRADKRSIDVYWSTESENNTSHFVVEKLLDNEWMELETVTASGTTTTTSNYAIIDYEAILGNNIYRLKSVDFDGEISYSDTRIVKLNADENNVQVFPNPANNTIYLALKNIAEKQVQLIDASGRVVACPISYSNEDLLTINLENIASGVYTIQVIDEQTINSRVVVQH